MLRLEINIEFRTLGHLFGINRGTACVIFHNTITAINTIVSPKYLKFLNGQSLRNVLDGFRTPWGINVGHAGKPHDAYFFCENLNCLEKQVLEIYFQVGQKTLTASTFHVSQLVTQLLH